MNERQRLCDYVSGSTEFFEIIFHVNMIVGAET